MTHFVVRQCSILDVTPESRRGSASTRVRKRDYLRNIKDEQTSARVMKHLDCARRLYGTVSRINPRCPRVPVLSACLCSARAPLRVLLGFTSRTELWCARAAQSPPLPSRCPHTAMAGESTDQRALQYEQTLVSSRSSFSYIARALCL